MNKITALKNHLEFKKTSVSSDDKLKDIERYLGRFLNSTNKSLNNLKEEDVVKFINSLDYKIRTINDIKVYIKVFIKWYYPDWSSRFRNLDRICKMQKPSRAYNPEDLVNLKDVEKLIKGEPDLMYKVYWGLFFFGGFRPSECAGLLWNQVLFESEGVIIKVHSTKTNKDFIKSLPKEIEHLLKEWRKYNQASEFVFPSSIIKNSPIKARGICGRLKRLSKKVLGREVVPYAMRHGFATIKYNDKELKKKGLSDDDIAQQLGHSKTMKSVYMNLSEEDIKANARMLWIKTKPLKDNEVKGILKRDTEFLTSFLDVFEKAARTKKDKKAFENLKIKLKNREELFRK